MTEIQAKESLESKIERYFVAGHTRYNALDKKLDATLEAVKVSKFTPVILFVAIVVAFAMGVWVG